jgi:hypothetical protein
MNGSKVWEGLVWLWTLIAAAAVGGVGVVVVVGSIDLAMTWSGIVRANPRFDGSNMVPPGSWDGLATGAIYFLAIAGAAGAGGWWVYRSGRSGR